jgi:hypothetical protein
VRDRFVISVVAAIVVASIFIAAGLAVYAPPTPNLSSLFSMLQNLISAGFGALVALLTHRGR